jgi:magnesium-transporting ATPase (P-type)
MHTNLQSGLIPTDFEEREAHFSSNYKEPQKRTPFCTLFMGALEDFMLRLLLVCACVSIIFDMSFADNQQRKTGKLQLLL